MRTIPLFRIAEDFSEEEVQLCYRKFFNYLASAISFIVAVQTISSLFKVSGARGWIMFSFEVHHLVVRALIDFNLLLATGLSFVDIPRFTRF